MCFSWCCKWRLSVNDVKSKVVHFRKKSHVRSDFEFHIGRNILHYVDQYKYLGVTLSEHLDFSITSSSLADLASRALGAVNSKFKVLKNMGFSSYSKLFDSCVSPILDYCSAVWGFGKHERCDTIQNRALRYFLGVNRFTPIHALTGDTGWHSCRVRRHISMIRNWNHLHFNLMKIG